VSGIVSRRRVIATATAAALTTPRARSADLAEVTLRIATFRGQDSTILPAAGQADFPYRVVYSEFNSGNLIAQAINADAIDLGGWSEIPMVFAAAAHANIAVVATLDGPTTDQAVLVGTQAPFRSIADLRGKRVGYVRATTAHYFLIRMLAQHDMSFHDIEPVPLTISAGLTAMVASSIDAWATYGYAIQTLKANGTARTLQNAADILSGHYFIGANPRRLDNPAFKDAAADYIRRVGRAYAILSADKPRWAKVVAPVIQVPEPVVLDYLNGQNHNYATRAWVDADIRTAQQVADTFASTGVLPPDIRIASVFSDALSGRLRR